jgi:hypothetical protein
MSAPREPTPEQFADAVRRLARAPPIVQNLPGPVAFILLSQLQLVLRHPHNRPGPDDRPDSAGAITRTLARDLEAAIVARAPGLAELCAMGWDPAHDR